MSKKGATDGFREVSASGSHFQIGETLGKQCRDQAIRMEKQFKEAISAVPGWSVDKMISYSRKSLPLSKRFYPEYIEELEGYAEVRRQVRSRLRDVLRRPYWTRQGLH